METLPIVFRGHHPDSIHRAIHHFDVLDLYPEETLIGAGERHPALVMVLRGQVEARRDGNDLIKEAEKDKEVSEDESKAGQKRIQDVTDKYIKTVDDIGANKEKEIMEV